MRLLAPRRFLDELLSSVWTRMCRDTSLPVTALTTQVVGRKWTPGFFQAGHLAQTAELFGVPPEQLLMRHTVFPYATAFFSPEVRVAAMRNALSVGVDARGVGAVTQSVSDHVDCRRYCRECAQQECNRTDESYWHRSHNLPGVLVCLKHRCMLHEVKALATNGRSSWSYALPHEVAGTLLRAPSTKARRFLNKLAELSVGLLSEPTLADGLTSVQCSSLGASTWYRDELVRRELLGSESQLDSVALRQYTSRVVAGGLPESVTRLDPETSESRWPHLMTQPGCKIPFIPLKHLIFRAALGLCPTTEEVRGMLNYVAQPHYRGKHRETIDGTCALRVRRAVDDALAAGKTLSVATALQMAGCWQLFRHSRTDFPQLEAEVRRLRTSEASLRKTSSRRIAMTKNRRQSCDF